HRAMITRLVVRLERASLFVAELRKRFIGYRFGDVKFIETWVRKVGSCDRRQWFRRIPLEFIKPMIDLLYRRKQCGEVVRSSDFACCHLRLRLFSLLRSFRYC